MVIKKQNSIGLWMAIVSGFVGATASCFGKFAFDNITTIIVKGGNDNDNDDYPFDTITSTIANMVCIGQNNSNDILTPSLISCNFIINQIVPRTICFILMILCNGIMLSTFLLALEHSGSVGGTAVSSASNMCFATLYGYIIFNDHIISYQWWIGFVMILVGVGILSSTQIESNNNDTNSSPSPTETNHNTGTTGNNIEMKLSLNKND